MFYISHNKQNTHCHINNIPIKYNNYSKLNSHYSTFIQKINKCSIQNNATFGIVNYKLIENKINPLLEYLTNDELILYHKFKSKKRQIQFLGARILSKILINNASNKITKKIKSSKLKENFKQISIIKNKYNNSPTIKPNYTNLKPSIAHKNKYIFSAISKNKIGIDVEEISPKLLNMKNIFSQKQEKILLNTNLDYAYLWASKEAIAKYLKTTIFQSIKNATLIKKNNNNIFTFSYKGYNKPILTHNFKYHDYVFCIAL